MLRKKISSRSTKTETINSKSNIFILCVLILINTELLATDDLSEINNLLFNAPHMQSIKTPGRLDYVYKKIGQNEPDRVDSISVVITQIAETGNTDQTYQFFSGVYRRPEQQRRDVSGNAIFMFFLEQDIRELERLTGGSWRHFQRRIRWALAQGAQKQDVVIDYQNSKIKAVQYSIQPYANDDKPERYGIYANKFYSFTLSKDIPGTIYEVRGFIPKNGTGQAQDEVLSEQRITFKSFTSKPAK